MHERYVLRGRPVAITGVTHDWPAHTTLAREAFRARFGAGRWMPQLLLPGKPATLAPYLDAAARGTHQRPISFNRPDDPHAMRDLRAQVRWPAALSLALPTGGGSGGPVAEADGGGGGGGGGGSTGIDFFVGSNGSGTPLHHHGAVWNALVYGRKLWALAPPKAASFGPPGQHPLDSDWWREWQHDARERHASSPQHHHHQFCVQEAGTLLYLPEGWGHATINLEEGLGVGGFLQEEGTLGLHMQLLHAPRGLGALQNAATIADVWFERVSRAFPVV